MAARADKWQHQAPMIPAKVADLVESCESGHAGTRSADLTPASHDPAFGFVSDDREHVVVLLPGFAMNRLEANVADNAWIAFTSNHGRTLRGCQLKGRVREVRAANPT